MTIDLDRAAGDRAEAHAESFAIAPDRDAVWRQRRAMDRLRLVGGDALLRREVGLELQLPSLLSYVHFI